LKVVNITTIPGETFCAVDFSILARGDDEFTSIIAEQSEIYHSAKVAEFWVLEYVEPVTCGIAMLTTLCNSERKASF
jgi:hypothetical protein